MKPCGPLGIAPDKIKLVMNDTAISPNSGPSGGSRQQVMTGNAIKNGCEMLLNAMRKPDGTYRTYEEMKAENIPLKYSGKWTASMCTPCDENGQGNPVSGLHVRRVHGRSSRGHEDRQDTGGEVHGCCRYRQNQQQACRGRPDLRRRGPGHRLGSFRGF